MIFDYGIFRAEVPAMETMAISKFKATCLAVLERFRRTRKPILLKRGIAATMEEWLLSAEYILSGGNTDVILCERGIRTFETFTRNTLDLSAIPIVKELSHLPIFVDPSHGMAGATRWRRWRAPRWRPVPMGSSSKCTTIPTAR